MSTKEIKKIEDINLSPSEFSGRIDKREAKSQLLREYISTPSLSQLMTDGKVDRNTLSRYLNDGDFSEKLKQIEHCMSSHLVSVAYSKACNDSDKDQARMIEFVLPALNDRFDSGVRRQKASNIGQLQSLLVSKLLSDVDPFLVQDQYSTDIDSHDD